MKMGKYMEKMLQHSAKDFKGRYILNPDGESSKNAEPDLPDYYHYTKTGNLLLRS